MWMLCSGIYMKAAIKFATQSVLWQHASYGVLDKALRMLGSDQRRCMFTLSTWIARVCEDHAIIPLLSRHSNLFRIDYNDIITAIYVR